MSDFTTSGVRVIQLNNIGDIYFNNDNKTFVSESKANELNSCNAYPGDIIFAKMMPAGRACVLPEIYKRYLLGSDAIRCKLDLNKCDLFFFLENINRISFRNFIASKTTGSTRKRIGLPELRNLTLLIPEIQEQRKIGKIFSIIEEKLNVTNKIITTLKKYKKGLSVLLIKQGIYCGKLADFVAVQEKTKLPSSYGNPHGLYPFFINNDENIEKYCDEYCFDGTYLILNTGGSASIKLYQGKFSVMSDCLVLKPKKNSIGLYYYLKSIEKKIDKVGFQGTGLRHLDQNWFFKQTIILPIIDENKLEKINLYLDAKTIILKKEIKILQKIKNYLLANLFI